MKVYVAGASSEIDRAERWMTALRDAGLEVTSSWPEVIRQVGTANPMTATREERAAWSRTDLDEVASSDVLWLLLPEGKASFGAGTEFGYALMLADSINPKTRNFWILVSGTEASIFTSLAEHYTTDDDAYQALKLRAALVGSLKKSNQSALIAEWMGETLVEPPSDGG